jgi:hypothetical protein
MKKEKTDGPLIFARIIGTVIITFFIWGCFQHSGNEIDKNFLGDHFSTSSVADWIGFILVIASIVWIDGLISIFKGGENVYAYGSENGWENVGIGAAMFIAGMLLIILT